MGLDLVELVMRTEDEFEIELPDAIAETITTPKKLIDYIWNLPKFQDGNRPREYIADKVWSLIEDELGVLREDYSEDSRFIEDMGAG